MTFRQRLGAGYAATLLLAVLIAGVSYLALRSVTESASTVLSDEAHNLVEAERLHAALERAVSTSRGYLLTGDAQFLARWSAAQDEFAQCLGRLEARVSSADEQTLLDRIAALASEHAAAVEEVFERYKSDLILESAISLFEKKALPKSVELNQAVDRLAEFKEELLNSAQRRSAAAASRAMKLILIIAGLAVLLSGGFAIGLTRALGRVYERELRARSETERLLKEREELMAIVSHDLRNPLNVVSLGAGAILMSAPEGGAGEFMRKQANRITQASERMSHLIRDLLDAARIEAGKLSIEPKPQELRAMVGDSLEMLSPLASQKSIELAERLPHNGVTVECDRERVLQVLSNLIGNAIKFTPEGGRIVVHAETGGSEVKLAVEDTGPGIPEEQQSHIFDRYWNRTGGGGLGLGLYIAKGIVEAHGGKLWLRSRTGEGSTFYFTLPAGATASAGAPRPIKGRASV